MTTDEKTLAEVGKAVEMCGKFIQLAAQPQPIAATITDEMYETERRKRILQTIVKGFSGKQMRIPLVLVAEYSGKNLDWFSTSDGKQALPLRNDERNNRHRADVAKFLCDLWGITYPKELVDYCDRKNDFKGLLAA